MTHACECRHARPVALNERPCQIHANQSVGDVIRQYPGALEVMQKMGVDHCCGGHLTLRAAAASVGVPLDVLLTALSEPSKDRV